MIIWFDNYMGMHVDKNATADNSFALANYGKNNNSVFFKANAVVDGNTVLFTHSQVTAAGREYAYDKYCSNSTGRKYFLKKELRRMESAIATYLRKEKGYRGKINVRFTVGITTQELFEELGYRYIKDSHHQSTYNWIGYDCGCNFVIVEKTL